MKIKILRVIIVFIFSCLFFGIPVVAQNEVADYQFQYEQYRKLYPQFTTARDKYLQYKTLVAQVEAIELTQKILVQRAQVMRTHFLLLKKRLNQTPEIVTQDKTRLRIELDEEIEWLGQHMAEVNFLSTPTLGDLFEISKRFERKEKDYRRLSYETTSRILLGNSKQLQSEAVAINFLLDGYLAKKEESEAVSTLRNWLRESGNSIYQAQKKIEEAEASLDELVKAKGDSKKTVSQFSKIKTSLEGLRVELIKVVGFQGEIIDKVEVNEG